MKTFGLMVVDEDRNKFATISPISDDTYWINLLSEAKKEGRKVRCFSYDLDKEATTIQWAKDQGWEEIVIGGIVYR